MGTTKQESIKVETGQRWRWLRPGISQECLADWWEVGEVRSNGNPKIARCAKGCRTHTAFSASTLKNGEHQYLGYAPGYGPQPPTFDPNKVCGAHGQPQFVLGMVLPCASPGCGNGPKGECYDMPLPADDCYVRLRFVRSVTEIAEGQALWRWKAEPCLDEIGIGSLAAKLRLDGWEIAIVKHAAVVVEKKVKPGSMPIPASLSQAVRDQQAQANAQFKGIDRDTVRQFYQQAVQEAHDRIVTQLGGTPAKMSVIPPKPKKPQHREVSTDGRHWIDYDRLADADSFDVYPHRRVDGIAVPMMATPPAFKVVGMYGLASGGEIHVSPPRSEFIRLPKPTPWKPSVDETDLLADVG